MKVDEFAKHAFSLQEKKVSSLILAFFFLLVIGTFFAYTSTAETRDFPPNIVNLLGALILAIGGVNAVEYWVNGKNRGDEAWKQEGSYKDSNQGNSY